MIRLVLLAAFLLGWTTEAGAAASHVVMDFNKFLTPGQYRGSFHLDDRERQFLIITPQGAKPDEPRPIVFFFHGAGGSAQQAAATYGWVEKARAERFFAVFPDGLPVRPDGKPDLMQNPRVWRDERGSMPSAVNDVAFFATLLDKGSTSAISFPKFLQHSGLLPSVQAIIGKFLHKKVPSCYARCW